MTAEKCRIPTLAGRERDAHKGCFGHCLVVGGSPGMTGAAKMAAHSSQLAGAGLITLGLPAGLRMTGDVGRASIMSRALPDTADNVLGLRAAMAVLDEVGKYDVCALGPGLGRARSTRMMVRRLVAEMDIPLVLDADGLNALAGSPEPLRARSRPAVVTPHPGEMARLVGNTTAAEIQKNRQEIAVQYAQQTGCCVVLKGHQTVVTDGDRCCLNETGNPGMATGGMGDVLTGLVAGFIAQGLTAFEAGRLGAFVHGLAGDLAADLEGETSLSPEFLMECVPEVLLVLQSLAAGEPVAPQKIIRGVRSEEATRNA